MIYVIIVVMWLFYPATMVLFEFDYSGVWK